MANEPEEHPSEAETPAHATEESLAALLVNAQNQLRDVIEKATSEAREDVEAAAAAVAAREQELSALESSLLSERATMQAQWDSVSERAATIAEREREVEAQIEETELLRDRAAQTIADALERSAQMIEEAETRVTEEEAASRARMEAELEAARTKAEQVHEQAKKRLEAARAESAVTLQRAAERSVGIVAAAEASVERSKAQLRQLVERIQQFLDWQETTALDLDAELDFDVRAGFESVSAKTVEPGAEEAPAGAEEAPAGVAEAPAGAEEHHVGVAPALGAIDVSANGADQEVAGVVAGSETTESDVEGADQPADEAESSDERVAKAVRRAVQGWSSTRRGQGDA